jgi:hypothetical protein
MAQACVSLLLGFVAIPLTASVTPPDCRFAKT